MDAASAHKVVGSRISRPALRWGVALLIVAAAGTAASLRTDALADMLDLSPVGATLVSVAPDRFEPVSGSQPADWAAADAVSVARYRAPLASMPQTVSIGDVFARAAR